MPRGGLRGSGLRFVALVAAVAAPVVGSAKDLTFEQAFSDVGEPEYLHYRAVFLSKGAEHQLEVWRDGGRRLRRRTDDAVETYASRTPPDPEFRLSILDHRKRTHTQVDRTNLYRIGSFTHWFDLAHGLRPPAGPYQVVASSEPAGAPKPIEACRWFDLRQDGRTTHVCWSMNRSIPLLLVDLTGRVHWRVVAIDTRRIPPETFAIHDEGFILVDANRDIEPD